MTVIKIGIKGEERCHTERRKNMGRNWWKRYCGKTETEGEALLWDDPHKMQMSKVDEKEDGTTLTLVLA